MPHQRLQRFDPLLIRLKGVSFAFWNAKVYLKKPVLHLLMKTFVLPLHICQHHVENKQVFIQIKDKLDSDLQARTGLVGPWFRTSPGIRRSCCHVCF